MSGERPWISGDLTITAAVPRPVFSARRLSKSISTVSQMPARIISAA